MEARAGKCASAGFDAVEFDNVDGAFNQTGFPLKPNDQLTCNARLANIAHTHGLSIGLKNDVGARQTEVLLPYFDFSVDEQCFQYHEWPRPASLRRRRKGRLQRRISGAGRPRSAPT
jgi:hypothetical protein